MSQPTAYGHLAFVFTGQRLPPQVLRSAAGFYIGTCDKDGPVSRESHEYFDSHDLALHALNTSCWQQRSDPSSQTGVLHMSTTLPDGTLEQIEREQQHFELAPHEFFQAWKRGVAIAGHTWFGNGTQEGLSSAVCIWDLCPRMADIDDHLDVMSRGERLFLAAMVSFYNAHDSVPLLKRCDFEGLADLGRLDLERRKVIADLILNYHGW